MGKLPPAPDAVYRLTIEKREGEGTRLWVDTLGQRVHLVLIEAEAITFNEQHRSSLRLDENLNRPPSPGLLRQLAGPADLGI